MVALAACGAGPTPGRSPDRPAAPADVLLVDANVFGHRGAIAIRGGRFVDGDGAKARETRDMHGAWLYPGLRDAHVHLTMYGDVLLGRVCDLASATSEADALEKVRAFITSRALGPDDWVSCQGWNEARWTEKRLPTSTAPLDAIVGGRPAIVTRQDGHTAWVSRRALTAGGVTRDTRVTGGEVMKDANGEPTGVLTDNALALVRRHEPLPTEADIEAAILRALDECARFGLVEVHDALVPPRVDAVFRRLAREGRLRMRVHAMIWLPTAQLGAYMEANAPVTSPIGGRYVVRTVKVFADGALGGESANLLAPYANRPTWRGVSRTSRVEVATLARIALRRGWQVATHAIGDAAIRDVLDGYEDAGVSPAARFRIEHASMVTDDDLARFAKMGIVASMQTGIPREPQVKLLGKDRTRTLWDVPRLARAGIHVALGTDVPPGVTAEPLHAVRATIARGATPEAAVGFASEGATFAAFAENERGGIRHGLAADLTVYDQDPLATKDAHVLGTFVDGTWTPR